MAACMAEIDSDFATYLNGNGILCWVSNDAVVPTDLLGTKVVTPREYDVEKHEAARKSQVAQLVAEYRATHQYTEQERAEIKNHLGPGAINVITGERV